MNKKDIIFQFFQKTNQLVVTNLNYRRSITSLFKWLIQNDQVKNDRTTSVILPLKKVHTKARIVTREKITLGGIEEIIYLLNTFTRLHCKTFGKDGETIQAGQSLIELEGNAQEILAYERVILNILQRLSGIATETGKLVSRLKSLKLVHLPYVAATRKTSWGLLDKKAVAMGGGLTHRLNLEDGILVKDNHLVIMRKLLGVKSEADTVTKILEKLLKHADKYLIEIEVEEAESIPKLIECFLLTQTNNVLGILLDNFFPVQAQQIIKKVKSKYPLSRVIFEASGGINSENISDWAKSGVDIISLGSLTHSAKVADISMEVLNSLN